MVSYIYGTIALDLNAPRGSRSKNQKKELNTPTDKKSIIKKQPDKESKKTSYKADKKIARKKSSDSNSSGSISQSNPSEDEKMPMIQN